MVSFSFDATRGGTFFRFIGFFKFFKLLAPEATTRAKIRHQQLKKLNKPKKLKKLLATPRPALLLFLPFLIGNKI
jgi:hypothetical protein